MSFANPHMGLYSFIFFWSYVIYLFMYKYNAKPNKWLISFCIFILTSLTLVFIAVETFYGQIYIHRMFLILGICYSASLYFATQFDLEIMMFCQKIAFIKKSARAYKIYLLLYYTSVIIIGLLFVSGRPKIWTHNVFWINNYFNTNQQYKDLNTGRYTNCGNYATLIDMGNRYGYQETITQLSAQIGIVFGASYSMPYINILSWIKSSWKIKLTRTLIVMLGILVNRVIYYYAITKNLDNESDPQYTPSNDSFRLYI